MAEPDFWNDSKTAADVNREAATLNNRLTTLSKATEEIDELDVAWEFIADAGEPDTEAPEYRGFEKRLAELEIHIDEIEIAALLSDDFDKSAAIVSVHAGAGGTESHDWVDMLSRMYFMFCQKMKFTSAVLDRTPGDVAGTKSITFRVEGELAYGYFKSEHGVHRLVRLSPFDANHRRHTSFAAVDVVPEIEADFDIGVDEKDLKIDTFRATGAGGQHVNTTDSAVRITHAPTGLVVTCQNERSQHKNREQAMRVLKSRLAALMRIEHKKRVEELRGETKDNAWGSQIRNYVLQPYQLAKDTRTGYETSNVGKVLDGDILPFIHAWLKGK